MNLARPQRPRSSPYQVQFSPAALSLMNGLPKGRRDDLTAYLDGKVSQDPYGEGEPSFERERRVLSVGPVKLTCMVTEATRMVTVVNLEERQA
jgi:hypothetical protein